MNNFKTSIFLATLGLFVLFHSFACGVQPTCQDGICNEYIADANEKTPDQPTKTDEKTPETECIPGKTQSCYTGEEGTLGKGPCQEGTQRCTLEGTWGPCLGDVLPSKELCNNKDDDCDGQIDNDFDKKGTSCTTQQAAPCDVGLYLLCKEGKLTCLSIYTTQAELCNGKDDNCDGHIDENFPDKDKECALNGVKGECVAGTYQCKEAKEICVPNNTPQAERCNNKDDDCDGQIDNFKRDCYTGPPNVGGIGACLQGYELCRNGQWESCKDDVLPTQETCNGKDDDCDGKVDNPPPGVTFCTSPKQCKYGACRASCQKTEECEKTEECKQNYCWKLSCTSSETACEHMCVDTQTSTQHCGACGKSCTDTQTCTTGKCACIPGFPDVCGSDCANKSESDRHCGTCFNACTNNTFCFRAKCSSSWVQHVNFYSLYRWLVTGGHIRTAAFDSKGNVYIAGQIEKYADFGSTKLTTPNFDDKYSAFLAKIDQKGRWVWTKRIINATHEKIYSITMDSSDNMYITGYFSGTAILGNTTIQSPTSAHGSHFLAKMDSQGNWKWALQPSVSLGKLFYKNGFLYASGSKNATTPTGNRIHHLFVGKMNPTNGLWVWNKTVTNSPESSSGGRTRVDAQGNIFILGSTYKDAKIGSYTVKKTGSILVKIDKNGNWAWVKEIGLTHNGIALDVNGNIYVGGPASTDFNGTQIPSQSTIDARVAKFDTNGKLKWISAFTAQNATANIRGLVSNAKGIYALGEFSGTIKVGSMTLTDSSTKGSLFIAKVDNNGAWSIVKQTKDSGNNFYIKLDASQTGSRLLLTNGYYSSVQIDGISVPSTNDESMYIWNFPAP